MAEFGLTQEAPSRAKQAVTNENPVVDSVFIDPEQEVMMRTYLYYYLQLVELNKYRGNWTGAKVAVGSATKLRLLSMASGRG